MKILAVDTSSATATIAVIDDDRLLGEYFLNNKTPHSKKLMPMIEQLLKALELTPYDIDIFAAAIGPGSFTGLRIGVAAVKGMAQVADKRVAGVSVLEAMAHNLPFCSNLICPILDARNQQVYCAVYRYGKDGLETFSEGRAVALADLLVELKATGEDVVFLGDGVPVNRLTIENELGNQCTFAPPSCNMQRASSVATVALGMAKQGRLTDAAGLVPEYLRKPQAERERENKLKMKN